MPGIDASYGLSQLNTDRIDVDFVAAVVADKNGWGI